jgi:hypothetical protein
MLRHTLGQTYGTGRRSAAKLLTKEEARRIAANVGKLTELVPRRSENLLHAGVGILKVGRELRVGTSVVQRVRDEMR